MPSGGSKFRALRLDFPQRQLAVYRLRGLGARERLGGGMPIGRRESEHSRLCASGTAKMPRDDRSVREVLFGWNAEKSERRPFKTSMKIFVGGSSKAHPSSSLLHPYASSQKRALHTGLLCAREWYGHREYSKARRRKWHSIGRGRRFPNEREGIVVLLPRRHLVRLHTEARKPILGSALFSLTSIF